MYARYIPLAKASIDPEPILHPEETAVAPPIPTRPGAYNRYIPTVKHSSEASHLRFDIEVDTITSEQPPTKRAKVTSNHENHVPESRFETDTQNATSNQASAFDHNSRKKSKKPKEDVQVKEATDPQAGEDGSSAAGIPSVIVAASEPRKEKKRKKNKKHELDIEQAHVLSGDDEAQRRHKSVFEKKQRSIKAPETETAAHDPSSGVVDEDLPMLDAPEAVAAHGLEPLPQPAPVPLDLSEPNYQTLPPWLAEPIRTPAGATSAWSSLGLLPELGITSEIAGRLAGKGYKDAFAIQTTVIPQLLPHHCRTMHSDILVSAVTGSGKTLAYALPMIRDLSYGNPHLTRLRALVVLPTRELVRQAQKVCEECAGIFALDGKKRRVKIGTATGHQTIGEERKTLLEREDRYDPLAYQQRKERITRDRTHDDESYDEDDEELIEIRKSEDRKNTSPDFVLDYKSKVDILICTPGRLVEHIKYTPGFNLDHVRWLIADEADKLLGQGFQQWLDILMPRLQVDKLNSRNHKQSSLSGIRKVILSATMTRDLDLLEGLKLRRPKLVILEGSGSGADYTLPEQLHEAALKADANLKPLFLLDLLQSSHLTDLKSRGDDSSDETSSSDSSSDSDSDSGSESGQRQTSHTSTAIPDKSVLIFTNSNQSALRLSRLLSILSPPLQEITSLLTSDTAYSTRKQTLQAFSTGKIRIIVASDLVARGIDLPHLEHVINYDIPSSVASYVHRVGRTARAGRSGHAWTLFTDAEARWFWKEVASDKMIRRGGKKVDRIRVTEEKEPSFEDKKARYEKALERLGDEVIEKRVR